jgi:sugar lactone lactonase YvrE
MYPGHPGTSRSTRRLFLSSLGIGALTLPTLGLALDEPAETPPPRFLREWGEYGKADGEFDACIGIAIGPGDVIHTSEFRNKRVQRFTTEGKFLSSFPVRLSPGGLAVDGRGNVYVAYWNDNLIAAYSPDGKVLREWGQKGTGEGEFQLPGSIAFGPDGLLYVPDQGNSRVQKFTTEGKFVSQWGTYGSEPGQFGGSVAAGGRFAGPQFVAFDRSGHVYTTDAALDRVQKFTSEGKFIALWGNESADPGGFGPPPLGKDGMPSQGGPIALCLDSQDRIWVSATNSRVQLYSNDGKYLCGLGGEGIQPGQFERPHALAIDTQGCLYVADAMNYRIQKFGWM